MWRWFVGAALVVSASCAAILGDDFRVNDDEGDNGSGSSNDCSDKSCEACTECAQADECSSENDACSNDEECTDLVFCLAGCDTQECASTDCFPFYSPEAIGLFTQLQGCVCGICNACGCSGA